MDVLRTLKERCDPKKAALIVVDVQNDFVSPDGSAAKRGEDVGAAVVMVPNLLRLIEEARRVGLTIVYIRTTHSEWTDTPSWIYRTSQKGGLSTCREGTWGAEFYEGISPLPTERVVIKHRYSAFIGTDLDMLLRARGVKSLLVTGVGTGMCVFHTLSVGFMLDYYITLVEDCCATTYGPQAHKEAVALIGKHYGRIACSDEIVDLWARAIRKAG